MQLEYQIPLKWPRLQAQTSQSLRSYNNGFKADLPMGEALKYLEEEILAIKPEKAILTSDFDHINVQRLRRKVGVSPGISLELWLNSRPYMIACDRWQLPEHNVYALHLLLRHVRTAERWGIGDIHCLLHGFLQEKRLIDSFHTGKSEEWMQMLGLGPTATLEDAHAVYRRRAKLVANDSEALLKLNNAMDEARKHLS